MNERVQTRQKAKAEGKRMSEKDRKRKRRGKETDKLTRKKS